MKNILLIVFICFLNQLSAQEIVEIKDLYIDAADDLTYKIADGKLFTGQAQYIRKNGHLVSEEYFENGIMTKSIIFYNGTEKSTPANETEYYLDTQTKRKETNYDLKKQITEFIHFEINGQKILVEQFENDKLIYRCEYQKNKKHGIEYCLNDDGTEIRIEYQNGRKVKEK